MSRAVVRSSSLFLRATLVIIALLIGGCGYRWGSPCPLMTLAIPFIDGDRDGSLTRAMIYELSMSSPFVYRSDGADYELTVRLVNREEENIGFRYEKSHKGKLKHSLIPDEMRAEIIAEITLNECSTGRCIVGPRLVSAAVEFDHDYYADRDAVNVYSLGQLVDVDSARKGASDPLYTALARAVADLLTASFHRLTDAQL